MHYFIYRKLLAEAEVIFDVGILFSDLVELTVLYQFVKAYRLPLHE